MTTERDMNVYKSHLMDESALEFTNTVRANWAHLVASKRNDNAMVSRLSHALDLSENQVISRLRNYEKGQLPYGASMKPNKQSKAILQIMDADNDLMKSMEHAANLIRLSRGRVRSNRGKVSLSDIDTKNGYRTLPLDDFISDYRAKNMGANTKKPNNSKDTAVLEQIKKLLGGTDDAHAVDTLKECKDKLNRSNMEMHELSQMILQIMNSLEVEIETNQDVIMKINKTFSRMDLNEMGLSK